MTPIGPLDGDAAGAAVVVVVLVVVVGGLVVVVVVVVVVAAVVVVVLVVVVGSSLTPSVVVGSLLRRPAAETSSLDPSAGRSPVSPVHDTSTSARASTGAAERKKQARRIIGRERIGEAAQRAPTRRSAHRMLRSDEWRCNDRADRGQ